MDTRYWGPSGWRLLHLISFSTVPKQKDLCAFFNTLAYVLPCKYCRKSFSENISADPVESADSISKWLWRIHNKVNDKLRKQHLCKIEDPTFQSVKSVYEERLSTGCTRTVFEGWEFLFSIAEGHPLSREGRKSTPIYGYPPVESLTDLEKNRWNILPPEDRLVYYNDFWKILPSVLPFKEWSEAWKKGVPDNRRDLFKHLWSNRCHMEKQLELLNSTTYNSLCRELKTYKSECSKSVRGKTCRKKRNRS